ncbi:unnamed protein product [Lactuca saligna]|uniref:Uncharacterized protein n=1 Tax=Lactuca saligna TaxID=75948 RepID=A0AA36A428_LACSI|nr:unnamed protein product [Lactuca saligna]
MLAHISASSNILQQYRMHPSSGPRELTPAMVRSIEEADKPMKRGKKPETHKEAQVSKPTNGKTPKKRKSDRAVTSPAQLKKLKKPVRRLILQSSSDSDSDASLSAAAKAIETSTSQRQQASLAVDASTKECKEATAKVDKLVYEAHLFLDSLQAAAKKNAQTVNASVDNLQRSLQSERSNLEAARQEIVAANESLHANGNDRLTQPKAELAVENCIMDELDRRTSQLKMQNY